MEIITTGTGILKTKILREILDQAIIINSYPEAKTYRKFYFNNDRSLYLIDTCIYCIT